MTKEPHVESGPGVAATRPLLVARGAANVFLKYAVGLANVDSSRWLSALPGPSRGVKFIIHLRANEIIRSGPMAGVQRRGGSGHFLKRQTGWP